MSKVSAVLFLTVLSACTAPKSFSHDDIEGWNPDIQTTPEWCYLQEGVTNKGNPCYWKPE